MYPSSALEIIRIVLHIQIIRIVLHIPPSASPSIICWSKSYMSYFVCKYFNLYLLKIKIVVFYKCTIVPLSHLKTIIFWYLQICYCSNVQLSHNYHNFLNSFVYLNLYLDKVHTLGLFNTSFKISLIFPQSIYFLTLICWNN